jgi:hypothetical protein
MIEALGLIGGQEAMDLLALYASELHGSAGKSTFTDLFSMCYCFDTDEYVRRVLSKAPSHSEDVFVSDRAQAACARQLSNIKSISRLQLYGVTDIRADLHDLPPIHQVWFNGNYSDISALSTHESSLQQVTLWTQSIADYSVFATLPCLNELQLGLINIPSVGFLEGIPSLTRVWLYGLDDVLDLPLLRSLQLLEVLRLSTENGSLPSLAFAAEMSKLAHLQIVASRPLSGFEEISAISQLTKLDMWRCDWLTDIEGIGRLSSLKSCNLQSSSLSDIEPIRELTSLRDLHLECPLVKNFAPLQEVASLESLTLEIADSSVGDPAFVKTLAMQLNDISASIRIYSWPGRDLVATKKRGLANVKITTPVTPSLNASEASDQ